MLHKIKKCMVLMIITVLCIKSIPQNIARVLEVFLWNVDTTVSCWSKNRWKGEDGSTGHKSMIHQLSDSCFKIENPNVDTNTMKRHRELMAIAAELTDTLNYMSPSANGQRDINGAVVALGGTIHVSPYHAKTDYTLEYATDRHAKFLYELARQILIKHREFHTNSKSYQGDSYYGIPIEQLTQRRIVNDITRLLKESEIVAKGVFTNEDIGYVILGVFAHALTDIYAHRAKISQSMVIMSSDKAFVGYYPYAVYSKSNSTSHVSGHDIRLGLSYDSLYELLGSAGIPMIRLKDYLYSGHKSIVINGKIYSDVTPNQAYEDCPYFWSDRYLSSIHALTNKLSNMVYDNGEQTSYTFTIYKEVPLI